MRNKKLIFFLLFLCTTHVFAQNRPAPVRIIFDSDMGPDYDDVGAITILHALADKGEAKILATIASTKYDGVAGVLNVFNTYFNKPNIPVGVPKGEALDIRDSQHWTDTLLANYPHKIQSNDEAEDAVVLYRRILASQPDHSVTIVTVGFLTNLSNLMSSRADMFSPLSGRELIAKKVKLLVSMAGKFPSGYEFNVMKDAPASKNVFENWSTPAVYSGFEIGEKIKTGLPLINNASISNSPVKDVFRIAIPKAAEDSAGRKSWDETAVLVAVRGYTRWYSLKYGTMVVNADGSNSWAYKGITKGYLAEKVDCKVVQGVINDLMMHQPVAQPTEKEAALTTPVALAPHAASSSSKQKTLGRIAKINAMTEKVKKMQTKIDQIEAKSAKVDKAESY